MSKLRTATHQKPSNPGQALFLKEAFAASEGFLGTSLSISFVATLPEQVPSWYLLGPPSAPCSPTQLCKWMNSMRQSGFSLARLTVLLNFDSSVLRTVPSTPQGLRKAHWIGKGVTEE